VKIAVIGCGLMGLCTARELAKRGHEVTAFEQFDLFHTLGSSHGESRIVRKAYPDAFYTKILLDAYPLWHELQKESDRPFLHEVGLVYFGQRGDPVISDQIEALAFLGVPFEIKLPGEARFHFEEGEVGVFTPEAGWVHAPTVLQTCQATAERHGARFIKHRVQSLNELKDFDRVVVTAGAWVRDFVDFPVSVRQATFAYVRGELDGPVYIESHDGQVYGFPNEPGKPTYKIGCHDLLRTIDPDEPRHGPDPAAIEVIRDFIDRRLGERDPEFAEAHTCLYTRTANDDFKFAKLDDRTVVASPCSGHGFKFGPWVGRLLADVCEHKADFSPWPRFVP
jgi:glycine/D-amino acid oxidase-like deaminating enzyme